jgi:hypothetical protein
MHNIFRISSDVQRDAEYIGDFSGYTSILDNAVRLYHCSFAFTLGLRFSVLLYLLRVSMGDMVL